MPRKRPAIACASFGDHVPNRVEALTPAPRHPPDLLFRRAALGNVLVEVKDHHVEAALRQNQPAVEGAAPRRSIHPRPRCIRRHQIWHPVAVTANIWAGFARIVIPKHVKELKSAQRTLGDSVCKRPALRWRVANSEHKLRHRLSLRLRKVADFTFIVFCGVAEIEHRGCKPRINQLSRGCHRPRGITVWFYISGQACRVNAAVRVTRDAIPVKRHRVLKPARRHR